VSTMLAQALYVGTGGFLGAILRFALGGAVHRCLAGATVLRGLEGFGAKSHLHTANILRLSTDLPILIEIVDTRDKIDAFLPLIEDAIEDGLATIEQVEILFYRSRGK